MKFGGEVYFRVEEEVAGNGLVEHEGVDYELGQGVDYEIN